jgi:hypothetical protein
MISIALDIETTGVDPETSQILEIGFVVFDTANNLTPFDELPKGKVRIQHQNIHGNIFAINMNKEIIADINRSIKDKDFVNEHRALGVLYVPTEDCAANWLHELITTKAKSAGFSIPAESSGEIWDFKKRLVFTAAGKNFSSFDMKFLERLPQWDSFFKINRRSLDPTLEYFNPITDEVPPDLNTCVERMKDSIRSLIIKAVYDGDPEVCKDLEELEKVILHEHSERHDSLCDCWDVIRTLRFKWEKDKLV